MIHSAQLPMGNVSEVTREPSSHVTSETQAALGPKRTRCHSCSVKIRAVSTQQRIRRTVAPYRERQMPHRDLGSPLTLSPRWAGSRTAACV